MLLIAVGCGGGGSMLISLVGSGGTGQALGIVTGFGSLILDGIRRNDASALYSSESNQDAPVSVPITSVVLGQHAEYSYDANGNVTAVLLSPEFVGPVSAVSEIGIVVFGTQITSNTDPALGPVTNFVGYGSMADIQVGDNVEAHGFLKTGSPGTTYLQATLVMKRSTLTGVRLTGIISQYDSGSGRFLLGNAVVAASAATRSATGGSIADGELATIWSNDLVSGKVINASSIRIKRPAFSNGNVTVSGPISNFSSISHFQIGNVTVDASQGAISSGNTGLANNKYVLVAGSYDVASNTLAAVSVKVFTSNEPTTVEVHGVVGSYVSPSSFTVRGVAIDASKAKFAGGSAAQLSNGAFVEIHGAVVENIVQATAVEIQAATPSKAPNNAVVQVSGVIASYNSATGVYTLTSDSDDNISCTLDSGVVYRNGIDTNLKIGQEVSITGVLNSTTLSSKVVSIKKAPNPNPGYMQLAGTAYDVTATSFRLNGLTIQINGIPIAGDLDDKHSTLAGSHVIVNVRSENGQYVAATITIDDD